MPFWGREDGAVLATRLLQHCDTLATADNSRQPSTTLSVCKGLQEDEAQARHTMVEWFCKALAGGHCRRELHGLEVAHRKKIREQEEAARLWLLGPWLVLCNGLWGKETERRGYLMQEEAGARKHLEWQLQRRLLYRPQVCGAFLVWCAIMLLSV